MLDRMRRRTSSTEGLSAATEHSEQILMLLNRIETALVVRDPGNARSAEAYDGLRKQVIAGANERRRMLVMLTQLNSALEAGTPPADVHSLVREWMDQAGLRPVTEPVTVELFDISGAGSSLKVVSPAWVDVNSQMVVTRGTAEGREPDPSDLADPEPLPSVQAEPAEPPTTTEPVSPLGATDRTTDEGAPR